jgi:phosphatidylinositol glycan class F
MADQSKKEKEKGKGNLSKSISAPQAFLIHLISGLGLAISLWVAHNFYSINLVSHPSITLRLIWVQFKNHSLVDFEVIVLNY